MGIRNLARATMLGAAAPTLASRPATSQLVTFSTSGTFSHGSCGSSLRAFGACILQWSGVSQQSWTPPTDVVLGDFAMTCYTAPAPREDHLRVDVHVDDHEERAECRRRNDLGWSGGNLIPAPFVDA